MSLGSWDPTAEQAAQQIEIEPALLARFIAYSQQQQLEDLPALISDEESQTLAGLMKIDAQVWQRACEALTEEDVVDLIRFFTVAEKLPGWEAGDQSPVIALAKHLRKQGTRLPRELLLWIREVSDNRFLPYGPL